MGAYAELWDGLRGYYASFSKERKSAGFSAAMALSFLFGVNLASIVSILLLASGQFIYFDWLFGNTVVLLLFGISDAYAHVRFAKSTGRYNSTDPPQSTTWKRVLTIYAVVTAALFVSAIAVAYFNRVSA